MRFLFVYVMAFFVVQNACGSAFGQADPRIQGLSVVTSISRFLQSSNGERLLGLTEEQIEAVKEIAKEHEQESQAVRRNETLTFDEASDEFRRIRQSLDEELKEELLPHQLRRIERLQVFEVISTRGLSRSTVDGVIALELELSVRERREFRDAAREALADYRKQVARLQEEAVAKMSESLPEEKREEFRAYVELIEQGDGLIWVPNTAHLDPDFESPFSIQFGEFVPPLDK